MISYEALKKSGHFGLRKGIRETLQGFGSGGLSYFVIARGCIISEIVLASNLCFKNAVFWVLSAGFCVIEDKNREMKLYFRI